MRLGILDQQAARPWNYGCAAVLVLGLLFSSTPATAQQGSQPGVDVRQLERRFETQDTAQAPGGRPGIAAGRRVDGSCRLWRKAHEDIGEPEHRQDMLELAHQ